MNKPTADHCQVLVIGGGNAALCAAISARENGADVLVLECAPKKSRGGNSRHTRNMRMMHESVYEPYTGAYPEEEYWNDYIKATGGVAEEELARKTIHESEECVHWMMERGVRFQGALTGVLHTARTNGWFLGGGKAMLNALYAFAEKLGVRFRYEAEVTDMDLKNGEFKSATVTNPDGSTMQVTADTVIVAAGGFQSNLELLKESWGEAVGNFLIRGTPYAQGTVFKMLIDAGAETVGDPSQGHMVPIDARSPKFDGGIVTRVDCVPLSVMVNKEGERFYDEGEDFWPMRYAIWGRLVAQQTDQIAYSLIDSKCYDKFMPTVFPAVTGDTLEEVIRQLELPVAKTLKTVENFNKAVRPGTFDHTKLDDCVTEGLTPPKTHWAQRLDTPPFYGYPLKPGLTFTYYGVKVDKRSQVVMKNGSLAKNVFAAGEIMTGNILPKGYVGGIGLVIGNIFGRAAGKAAAEMLSRRS